jgi:hypothetical protein
MIDGQLTWWRRSLDDHSRAIDHLQRAERILEEALLTPGKPGIEIATRRVAKAEKRMARATFILTAGRPLHEVMWSLPDEL